MPEHGCVCGLVKRWFSSTPARLLKQRAKGKRTEWLERHVRDQYVKKSKDLHFRARSAFKLIQIEEKYKILKPGHIVIDCGAAPGAWTQVAVPRVNADLSDPASPRGVVISVDLLLMQHVEGATLLPHRDLTKPETRDVLERVLGGVGRCDVVMSDAAPPRTSDKGLDHERIMPLCYAALGLAVHFLRAGGTFLCKVWDGAHTTTLVEHVGHIFEQVNICKPHASRSESSELYVLGRKYRG